MWRRARSGSPCSGFAVGNALPSIAASARAWAWGWRGGNWRSWVGAGVVPGGRRRLRRLGRLRRRRCRWCGRGRRRRRRRRRVVDIDHLVHRWDGWKDAPCLNRPRRWALHDLLDENLQVAERRHAEQRGDTRDATRSENEQGEPPGPVFLGVIVPYGSANRNSSNAHFDLLGLWRGPATARSRRGSRPGSKSEPPEDQNGRSTANLRRTARERRLRAPRPGHRKGQHPLGERARHGLDHLQARFHRWVLFHEPEHLFRRFGVQPDACDPPSRVVVPDPTG
jgi:hypothetical protein